MKTRLNEISLAQFIELLCGNYYLLLDDGDQVNKEELERCAHSLIASYRFIADKSGMRAFIVKKEERSITYYCQETRKSLLWKRAQKRLTT